MNLNFIRFAVAIAFIAFLLVVFMVVSEPDELIGKTVHIKGTDINGVVNQRHPLIADLVVVLSKDGKSIITDVRTLELK